MKNRIVMLTLALYLYLPALPVRSQNPERRQMRYIDIFATLGSMHWDLGVCYDAVREHSMKDEGQQQMDTPYFITSDGRKKYEAVYDVYHTNTKLDDSYPLLDGTISIRDAIASAEHYLNEVVPVEGEEHVRLVIERVYVHKISDALYAFRYEIKRQMYGVNMPYESQDASTTNLDFWSDSTQAYQIEKDKIDICDGFKKVVNLKTEKEIKEVLPLRDAIGILEDEIGDNSTYSVFGVELGYLFLCDDGWSGTDAGSGSVCWVFKTYNESD